MEYRIGIDLGGTNIAAGLVGPDYRLVAKESLPTGSHRPAEEIIRDMARTVELTLAAANLTLADLPYVGVGVPGAISADGRRVLFTPNLDWRDLPLADGLEALLHLPVYLGNDADCAALGEVTAGAAAGCKSAIMITLGTGVGGGIIENGRIFRGFTGTGCEPGHISLIFGGAQCGCGQLGCFEAYGSASGLIRQTHQAVLDHPESRMLDFCDGDLDKISGRTAFLAARAGDAVAQAVVDQYISYVAAGAASLVNIFRPEILIMGGGISNEGDPLLVPLNEKLQHYCYAAQYIAPPKAVRATLGNDAGILGAALLGEGALA